VVLADLELELQRLADGRRARDVDEVHDLLRLLGPLALWEIDARCVAGSGERVESWVDQLVGERRAIQVSIAGDERVAAADDAARLRDALGVALPVGLPAAFTDPVAAPLVDLVARFARTHGPFLAGQVAQRYGLGADRIAAALDQLEQQGRLVRGEFRPDGIEREWCDDDVLRQLRRRSLASLRKEVEPVDASALARFLPEWHAIGEPRRGVDAVVEAIGLLQGAALPASVLERDLLAARVRGYQPADLDALCTAGDVVWVGAGPLGATDGRVRLLFRDQAALLVASPDVAAELTDDAGSEVSGVLREALAAGGAAFWPDLVAAVAAAGEPYDDPAVLAALWDLVWAGVVTNDSMAPLRAAVSGRRRSPSRGRYAGAAATASWSRRPDLGRTSGSLRRRRPDTRGLSRGGPPAAAGRWSLVTPLLLPSPTPTEAMHAQALQLLERHGVLTREAVLAEGVEGGFAAVYPVLKVLEERGQVRRGYFVAGLGAAQFALPGAVDRLRSTREPIDAPAVPLVLAATDPAQPFGAALAWPESAGRPSRAAGAFVVSVAGEPMAYLERGARSLATFPGATDHPHWAEGLVTLVKNGRLAKIELGHIDAVAARESPIADQLRAVGFVDGYKGLALRA
jgi:ATP-dependent helicase Lhr and Lhr-like helicase